MTRRTMFAAYPSVSRRADVGTPAHLDTVSARQSSEPDRFPVPTQAAPGMPCAVCIRWHAPLTLPARVTPDGVEVTCSFEQWLVWAWHVRTHRRLHVAARDFTESDS